MTFKTKASLCPNSASTITLISVCIYKEAALKPLLGPSGHCRHVTVFSREKWVSREKWTCYT